MPVVDGSVPEAGDVLWIDFGPHTGREQGGRRPAVVLTSADYNRISSVLLVCPITSRRRDWPFQVELPAGEPVAGVVLVDQVKAVDPSIHPPRREGKLSPAALMLVYGLLAGLLGIPVSN
jgi:mRNA interferase MazF